MSLWPIQLRDNSRCSGRRSLVDWLTVEPTPSEKHSLSLENLLNEIMDEESFQTLRGDFLAKLFGIDRPLGNGECPIKGSGIKRRSRLEKARDSESKKARGSSSTRALVPQGFWGPRRVDHPDSVEWHLEGDSEWIRPQDVRLSLDADSRTVEVRARREETEGVPCEDCKAKEEKEEEEQETRPCPQCTTSFTSIRETRRAFTLPEDVDVDQLEASLTSDGSAFVVTAPRKRSLPAETADRIPLKILRK